MAGTLFFVVQFLQNVQGDTAFESGLRTLPVSIGIFAVAPFAGRLTARIGPRLPIVLGALFCASSLLLVTRMEPDTGYTTLWWQFALFGIGCGLMLTPLAAAVLSATPPERSGLSSSILNTSRTVGLSLGVAVLGALVLQQFPGNIASQLTARGLPNTVSTTIAQKIASAGASAGQATQPGHLPLSPAALHQAVGQAFVDTLHGTFLISAIGLCAAALLAAFLLWQKRSAMSAETVDLQAITGAQVAVSE
jgi:DHA2 family methylenomycin A resistance protein-like MFS transporter